MSNCVDLTGNRYGRLTVLERAENYVSPTGHTKANWLCMCDCGNKTVAMSSNLRRGITKSCGCLQSEVRLTSSTKHGGRHDRLYSVWTNIKSRCYNRSYSDYDDYGGRGITMCDEWKCSYAAFRDWALSAGYSSDLTIDRVNVNGPYAPWNCRWADAHTQSNNRRNTIMITYGGKTQSLSDWAIECGLKYHTLFARIYKLHWSLDKALTTHD